MMRLKRIAGCNWQLWAFSLLAFLCIHVLLASTLCASLPRSRYRNFCRREGSRLDQDRAKQRSLDAVQFLEGMNSTAKSWMQQMLTKRLQSGTSDICVVIVTVLRKAVPEREQYLFQVLRSLLPDVLGDARASIVIANAQANATDHTALRRYASFVPHHHIQRAKSSADEWPKDTREHFFTKERFDYGRALQTCLVYKPQFVVVLEDDTAPHPHFLSRLRHLIKGTLTEQYTPVNKLEKAWAYVKLYYPERWSGFQNEDTLYLVLVSLFVGVALLTVAQLVAMVANSLSSRPSPAQPWLLSADHLAIVSVIVLSVLWMVGRYHLENLRLFFNAALAVSAPADRCCTPAVLYQSWAAELLAYHLIQNAHSHRIAMETDLAISDFAESNHWRTCRVRPNLAVHHGRVSTLPKVVMDDVT